MWSGRWTPGLSGFRDEATSKSPASDPFDFVSVLADLQTGGRCKPLAGSGSSERTPMRSKPLQSTTFILNHLPSSPVVVHIVALNPTAPMGRFTVPRWHFETAARKLRRPWIHVAAIAHNELPARTGACSGRTAARSSQTGVASLPVHSSESADEVLIAATGSTRAFSLHTVPPEPGRLR